jgi:hypothetical protein
VAAEEVEDDDPEIDLGDIKVKKSELKAGYMKDGDYRRKTAEAAEVKRAAEAERMQVRQEREYHANQLEVLIHGLQTQLVGDQQALAQLAESDPAEWVRENAAFQQRYAKQQEREQAEWRKAEREALREKLPEWNDPQKAQAEQKMVAEYLISQGYAADDLANLFDHRALVVAREAALWRQHQAAQKTLKDKQVKPEPQKGLKPGAAQQKTQDQQASKVDELRKRAQRTGNQDDIAAYLIAKSG